MAEDTIQKRIQDPDLWIYFPLPRYIRANNIEVADAVMKSCYQGNKDKMVNPEEILGVQYIIDVSQWYIYVATKEVKAILLALDTIEIQGKSYKLNDYARSKQIKKTDKLIRLSIHDIPLSVPPEYIGQWVDTFAKRETDVEMHIVKNKHEDATTGKKWQHLLSGHRFCYVSKIHEQKDRYSMMSIPDPRDARLLIDVPVILYYNGQHINCSVCHSYDHLYKECGERAIMKCYSCGKTGHTQAKCPQPRSLPICFKCKLQGHIARNCPQKPPNQERLIETKTSEKAATDGSKMIVKPPGPESRSDREPPRAPVINSVVNDEQSEIKEPSDPPAPADPLKWVEALIDRAVNPTSGPESPELLNKVESYLHEARRKSQAATPPENDSAAKQPPTADVVVKSVANPEGKTKKQTTLTGEKYEQPQDTKTKDKKSEKKKKKKNKRKNEMSPQPEELRAQNKKERRLSPIPIEETLSPPSSSDDEDQY